MPDNRQCPVTAPAGSPSGALALLAQWDLAPVRKRLEKELRWSRSYAERVEAEYRKFMSLTVLADGNVLGISKIVDEFWHAHILDTLAYFEFCASVFGRYIHHRPKHEAGTPTAYGTTLRLLERDYGGRDDVIWPDAVAEPHADCACQSGCDKIDAGSAQVAVAG